MINALFAALLLLASATSTVAFAQKLPPPSRTVFKCEEAGKVVYSDAPCLGAKKVNVEPTRGLNKSTGQERIGQDVRREQQREIMADALRPLTGMDAKQLDRSGRRMKLSTEEQKACRNLDSEIPRIEGREKLASGQEFEGVQRRLLSLRTAYRSAGCE